MLRLVEKSNPHPGGDISHAPIIRPTAIYTYINCKAAHIVRVEVTAQRPTGRVFPSTATRQQPLWLGLGLVRVKNSLEVFRPHGDLDSLLSLNLCI